MECLIGTYVNAAKTACLECKAHTYQDEANQDSCKDCPSGTETADVGSDSLSDCQGKCHLLFSNCDKKSVDSIEVVFDDLSCHYLKRPNCLLLLFGNIQDEQH